MRMFVVVLVALLALGAGGWYWLGGSTPQVEFRTSPLKRGDLMATISATGTIEPEEVVDVGAQVAGLIVKFGNDADGKQVDYRSPVKAGMVLAQIDDAVYRADRDTAKAQLEQAKAAVHKAQADVQQVEALEYQAQQNWERAQKIGQGDALSKNDFDMYQANYRSSQANVAVSRAELEQAQTGIAQAQAALDKAQRNLDFCTIVSPVDGVIISRRVNVGQTVVSSLNAPSLFLIAKDLTKMQIWVAVNEADIGHVFPGQDVIFTCDALTGRTFAGKVNKVRLNAQITQNVVTYTVEVNCENPGGELLPYMTANVQFVLNKEKNVLTVPNAALRWYPGGAEEVAPDVRSQWKPVDDDDEAGPKGPPEGGTPHPGGGSGHGKKKAKPVRHATVWFRDGTFVRPLSVTVGPTDGINTEISGDNLKEGQEIVVGEVVQTASDSEERNPFLPQMHHGKSH